MTLTYAQLDSEVLERSNLDNLPTLGRNIVLDIVRKRFTLLSNEILIPSGIPLSWLQALPLSPRARNAVQRAFGERGEDDQLGWPMSVLEFLSIPNVGITTSIEILCVVESAELGQLGDVDWDQVDGGESGFNRIAFEWAVERAFQRRLKAFSPLIEPVQLFSEWAQSETNAETLGEAIRTAASRHDSVRRWEMVAGLRLSNLSIPQPHPYALLDSWSEELDVREATIFRHRICRSERTTLEELGRMFSLTRERIRQIEGHVRRKLRSFLAGPDAEPIHWRVGSLRNVIRVAAPRRVAEKLLEAPVGSGDYRSILLDVAGPYALEGDWLIHQASRDNDPTDSIRLGADEFGRIDPEAATSALSSWGLDTSFHREWLTRDSSIREFNGGLVCWSASLGGRLAFALADLGRPATIYELMNYLQEDSSLAYVRNTLTSDERVVRVDKVRYGLRSWGLDEYEGIVHSIRELIDEAKGPLPIDDVVDRITQNFGVAETSVRQYAHAPIFVVDGDVVRLRTEDEPFQYPRSSVRRAPGVFALGPGRVALIRKVDADLLRGSGHILAYAAGDILGVEVNSRVTLKNVEGDIAALTYPESSIVGPSIGSIRALAERLSAKIGDYMTLVMDRSDLSVSAQVTRPDVSAPSWDLVSRLTGIEAQSGMAGLAKALQCTPTEVRSILGSRGDEVVLEALPRVECELREGGLAADGVVTPQGRQWVGRQEASLRSR